MRGIVSSATQQHWKDTSYQQPFQQAQLHEVERMLSKDRETICKTTYPSLYGDKLNPEFSNRVSFFVLPPNPDGLELDQYYPAMHHILSAIVQY